MVRSRVGDPGRFQRPGEVQENEQPLVQLNHTDQVVGMSGLDLVRRRDHPLGRDLLNLSDRVNQQAEHATAYFGHDDPGGGTGHQRSEPEPGADLDDRENATAEVGYAANVWGRLWHPRDLAHPDHLTNGLDREAE